MVTYFFTSLFFKYIFKNIYFYKKIKISCHQQNLAPANVSKVFNTYGVPIKSKRRYQVSALQVALQNQNLLIVDPFQKKWKKKQKTGVQYATIAWEPTQAHLRCNLFAST